MATKNTNKVEETEAVVEVKAKESTTTGFCCLVIYNLSFFIPKQLENHFSTCCNLYLISIISLIPIITYALA